MDFWIVNSTAYERMHILLNGEMTDGAEDAVFFYLADDVDRGSQIEMDFSQTTKILEDDPYTLGFGNYAYHYARLDFRKDGESLAQSDVILYPHDPYFYYGGAKRILYQIGATPALTVHPVSSRFIYASSLGGSTYMHYFRKEHPSDSTLPLANQVGGTLSIKADKATIYPGETQRFTLQSADGSELYQIIKYVAGRPVQNVQIEIHKEGQLIETVQGTQWKVDMNTAPGEYTATIVDAYGFPIDSDGNSVAFSVLELDDDDDDDTAPRRSTPPAKENLTMDVESGDLGAGVEIAKISITRTTHADGSVHDEIRIDEEQAEELIKRLPTQPSPTVRLVLPDHGGQVDETYVRFSKEAVRTFAARRANLEIHSPDAYIQVPAESLSGFENDLYFRIIPVQDDRVVEELTGRAQQEKIVREVSDGKAVITVLGRPMMIETNMTSRPVTITLPLDHLPDDVQEPQNILDNLVVYIEHDDGSREIVQGSLVTHPDGSLGVRFTVNRFSTFAIVHVPGWQQYLAANPHTHLPYVNGYGDQTFRPDQSMTRAEFAAILARIMDVDPTANHEETHDFVDVPASHWAHDEISLAAALGLVNGYGDGGFRPDQRITRAEMATIIAKWKADELAGITDMSGLTDITGHWAEQNILKIAQKGWIIGYPTGEFRPDAAVTRAEVVTVINRVLQRGPLQGSFSPKWNDVPASHFAYGHIHEASISHRSLDTGQGELFLSEK